MTVRIRMKKMGRKHRPFFRICIMDSRSPRDGKAIEEVGHYDPMIRSKSDRVQMDMERARLLNVNGTPYILVNGYPTSYWDAQDLEVMISRTK